MSLVRLPLAKYKEKNDAWQIFISQNINFTLEWGGKEKQEQWGKLFLLALQRCDAWLVNESKVKSLGDIYYFLAYERIKIARILGHKLTYGMPRRSNSTRSSFSQNRLRTKSLYLDIKKKFFAMPKNHNGKVEYKILLEGKKKLVLTLSFNHEKEILYIDYPSIEIAEKLMQSANKIWLNLVSRKDDLSIEDKYFQLGKILWHLAIGRPLAFGSASVSEALYYTLAKQVDLPLVALHFGRKVWDIWAMYHAAPDEFAVWFSRIMLQSFSNSSHFTFPSLDYIDNTAAIEDEVKTIFNWAKKNNEYYNEETQGTALYQTTQLVDPYGLGLFHHYCLFFFKIEFEKLRNLTNISTPYKKEMKLPYKMLPNGQVLFLDALINPHTIDPVIFKMNMMSNVHFRELKTSQKEMNKAVILDKIQKDLDRYYHYASNEIKHKCLLNYFNYVISLFDNSEIKHLAKNGKEIIQNIISNNSFEEMHLKVSFNDIVTRLSELTKIEKIYTDTQLIKLIEIADCMDIEFHFQNFIMQDWLSSRVNGKSFLDVVLKTRNSTLIIFFLKKIAVDQLETIMNYVADKNDHQQIEFLFFKLIDVFPLNILSKQIPFWLDQHPNVNILSLVFDNNNPIRISLADLLPALFQNISSVKIEQISIKNVLSIRNIANKVVAVDFFVKNGMKLSLPTVIDKNLIDDIKRYIFYSDNINICRQLCRQLEPKMIKKIITIDDYFCYPSQKNNNSIINFCKILNELTTNSTSGYNPILFTLRSPKEAFQQAVIKGICQYMRHAFDIDFDILKNYFMHLDFLTQENLQKFKTILCNTGCKESAVSLVAMLDEKIKTFSPPTTPIFS